MGDDKFGQTALVGAVQEAIVVQRDLSRDLSVSTPRWSVSRSLGRERQRQRTRPTRLFC